MSRGSLSKAQSRSLIFWDKMPEAQFIAHRSSQVVMKHKLDRLEKVRDPFPIGISFA